jgi:hypothetical protein
MAQEHTGLLCVQPSAAACVKLVDWVNDLVAHKQTAHVGP